ncbi:MAG: carbohydrate ABC transporter permease [Actinomycetota bacterium]
MKRSRRASVALFLTALAVGGFSVLPFFWMLSTSLKPEEDIVRRVPVLWPSDPTLERYGRVLEVGFQRALGNSALVALGTTAAAAVLAAAAGYALARFDLPLRRYLLVLVMSAQMFPIVALIIPMFVVLRSTGLLDSRLGLVVAYLSFTCPLAIWILKSFFETIPPELEEAAMIDGATRMGAMRRVILPLAGPGLAACAIFSFIAAWNEFLLALTFVKDEKMATMPVALQGFIGGFQADWGMIMAASFLFTIPVVAFFLLLHRRLVQGMVTGAIQG